MADEVQIVPSNTSTETESKMTVDTVSGERILAAAIILSRKVGDVWQRSTQYLMPRGDVSVVDTIIKLWKMGSTEIATENPYYLNNADL